VAVTAAAVAALRATPILAPLAPVPSPPPVVAAPVAASITTAAPAPPAPVVAKLVVPSDQKDASENKFMVEYSKNLGDMKKIVSSNDNRELQSNVLNIESSTLTPLDESVANPA